MIFLARVVGYFVDSWLRRNDEESSGPGIDCMITVVICEIMIRHPGQRDRGVASRATASSARTQARPA